MNESKGDSQIIRALARGETVSAAAKAGKVHRATVHNRLRDPAFRSAVQDARRRLFDKALGRLARDAETAAATFGELLVVNPEGPDANERRVQLASARAILELGPKLRGALELEERMERLERLEDLGRLKGIQ